MSDNAEQQLRFGENGELEELEEEDRSDNLQDDGETPMGRFQTKSGQNAFEIVSALQKAVRRSNEELAAWSAWELVRSGYPGWYWNRITLICVEELESGDPTILEVAKLEELGKDRWEMDSWEGMVCAIRASIAAARAPKSREHVHANRVFTAMKNERIEANREDREPEYNFPAFGDETFDQHTQAGRTRNRGFHHFLVHSGRLSGETDLGLKFKEFLMNNVEMAYPDKDISQDEISKEDIKTALTPVEPGEHDEPEEVNRTLEEL